MKPPAGRITLGGRVQAPGGRQGEVASERLIASNGAWKYVVTFDDGGSAEYLDFELKRVESA
jgi:hypothetical protein